MTFVFFGTTVVNLRQCPLYFVQNELFLQNMPCRQHTPQQHELQSDIYKICFPASDARSGNARCYSAKEGVHRGHRPRTWWR